LLIGACFSPTSGLMAADAAARRRRALVVSDNRRAADKLAGLLRLKGYTARVANGGTLAMVIIRAWPPDVAILDVATDVVSGVELAKRVRNEVGGPIMLVAVAAAGASDELARVNASVFGHCFLKPVNQDELLGLLEARASRRQSDPA
jgi:DNA-binding response OmpR family regulator